MTFQEVFVIVGNIASLLSLLISIFAGLVIHFFYNRQIILPKLISKLNGLIKNMLYQNKRNNIQQVRKELELCDVVLERFPKYADKVVKKRTKDTREALKSLLSGNNSNFQENAARIIDKIEGCVKSADIFIIEDKWKT